MSVRLLEAKRQRDSAEADIADARRWMLPQAQIRATDLVSAIGCLTSAVRHIAAAEAIERLGVEGEP